MFGKNYDKTIEDIYKKISEIVEMQNKNQKALLQMIKDIHGLIDGINKNLLEIAKVQKSHKEAIMILSKK